MLPPASFFPTLLTFHLFPLHAPVTLYVLDAPFGRFASGKSRWNLPGNLAWSAMELVAPATFLTTLLHDQHPALTTHAKLLAGMYLTHYLHRAVISPLVSSPKRSSLHITVPLAAALFNVINGYLLAIGLACYPPTATGWTFWLGVVGWTTGFVGNGSYTLLLDRSTMLSDRVVYHDEILNDLRREPGQRVITGHLPEDGDPKAGRYKIPRGGLFRYISFPNYLCEWFEWIAFSLAASPYPLISLPAASTLALQSNITGKIASTIAQIWWPSALLAPPWMFVLAEITSMLPRAVRGHRWYKQKFGDRYPQERRAVIPGLL